MISRRGFISGLAAALAAPAIVRAGVLMPISAIKEPAWVPLSWFLADDIPLYEMRWRGRPTQPVIPVIDYPGSCDMIDAIPDRTWVNAADCDERFMRRYAESVFAPAIPEAELLAAAEPHWAVQATKIGGYVTGKVDVWRGYNNSAAIDPPFWRDRIAGFAHDS
jgi:hypothetical protein